MYNSPSRDESAKCGVAPYAPVENSPLPCGCGIVKVSQVRKAGSEPRTGQDPRSEIVTHSPSPFQSGARNGSAWKCSPNALFFGALPAVLPLPPVMSEQLYRVWRAD